ncbi:hypothetical protein GGI1_05321 [Acidithiobacillus sp. GGI-221]|nr:hypothetical protein GGI1_05321 [Acidithiobacillus sp. GGI-221]
MSTLSSDMRVLRNEAQFKRWARESGFEGLLRTPPEDAEAFGMDRKELRERKKQWYENHAPKTYPCLGFSALVSFVYEETEPRYLYLEDLRAFLAAMETEVHSHESSNRR